MISRGVEMQLGSHGIRTQNAVSTNVFGDNQFIGFERDSTGTSRAAKNGNIPDVKKNPIWFDIYCCKTSHLEHRPSPYQHRARGLSCGDLEFVPLPCCSGIAQGQAPEPVGQALKATLRAPLHSPECSIPAQDLCLSHLMAFKITAAGGFYSIPFYFCSTNYHRKTLLPSNTQQVSLHADFPSKSQTDLPNFIFRVWNEMILSETALSVLEFNFKKFFSF